jgi:uncharacterized protein (DUF302 family)
MQKFKLILGNLLVIIAMSGFSQAKKKNKIMEEKYYFKTTVTGNINDVRQKTEEVFKSKTFSLISEIAMHEKLEEKLENVDMHPYLILGFCNPAYAYETIKVEEYIGLFLPCKVILKDNGDGTVDVVAINPEKAMQAIGNEKLDEIAKDVTQKFREAIEAMPDKV